MRLEEITVSKVNRAIDLYIEVAYGDVEPPASLNRVPGADEARISGVMTHVFLDESPDDPRGARAYALRLGNRRYAFMKLRLVEFLYRDEFFFSVDTHDQMFDAAGDPELARLMAFNRELKEAIEASWEGAGLPTTVNLQGVLECVPLDREPSRDTCILLVDDNAAILDTVALMLEVKGYEVDIACDGQEALEVVDASRHALILMDVEMPRMNGIEACEELKSDPELARIPVLLASAGAIELARTASPDGFLVKPFQAEALFRFVEAMLRQPTDENGDV